MKKRLSKGSSRQAGLFNGKCRRIGRRRVGAGLGLIVGMSAVAFIVTAFALAVPWPAAAQGISRTVTLITGDRVIVSGGRNSQSVSIQRASGRSSVRFVTQRVAPQPGQSPHLYVIPEDALPIIAAGKVDRRLFDVTLLIDFEYDDAHRESLPLIVTYKPSSGQKSAASAQQLTTSARGLSGAVNGKTLPSIDGMSATAPKARVQEVWGAIVSAQTAAGARTLAVAGESIRKVWLDGLLWPVLDRSAPQIGAPAAWDLGYYGDGVLVAVLDTGVDNTHPDLVDRVVGSRNFTDEDDFDEVGHGTHVASIIAGSGAASGGRYRGVAPGAELLSGKVCEFYGCMESSIIAGMEWAAMEEGAQVVNLSLGGTDEPGLDPLEEAVNTLTVEYGTLFVIAAGNDGPDEETVSSPGSAEQALTVGAVERDDEVAFFSGRGLTVGDHAIKPDITAPGVDIVAARAAGSELGEPVDEYYMTLSGTSMATPHVVGAVALLFQQHPEWGPVEAKAALMGSAAFIPDWTVLDQGAGRVDVANALDTNVIASTPSVSFGLATWPHDDDEPVTRTVTYRNLGSATQLVFEIDVLGPEGVLPPADMFAVTPATVSLPAGGTVSVTVTADTSVEVPDGVYSGRLIAADDTNRILSVPLAVNREVESYNLVLRHLDRTGAPTANWFDTLVGLDRPMFRWIDPAGPEPADVTLRLPAGRYVVETLMFGNIFDDVFTLILAPNQQLTEDRLLVMDAGLASPMSVTPPKPEIENISVEETWGIQTDCCGIESGFGAAGVTGIAFYQAEIEPFAPDLYSLLSAQWLDSASTPEELYSAAWKEHGRLPVGPVKEVDIHKLAVVHEHYAAPVQTPEAPRIPNVVMGVGVYGGDEFFSASASLWPVELPYERTEYYYSEDKGPRWWKVMLMYDDAFSNYAIFDGGFASYRAHRSYWTQWSQAPFSPLSPDPSSWLGSAYRSGDELLVGLPMYGDREGHAVYMPIEGRTALYANGELIGESEYGDGGYFEVPSDPAEYRLEISYSQSMFELTTHQEVVWTFNSAHVDEGETERLPLITVHFTPELNELGEAPRGHFRLPLSVAQYGQNRPAVVREPFVEVSYNDGTTWARVPVKREGGTWNVLLNHPRCADYVSLRARTHDHEGNAVEQTLIRAYALAGYH